MGAITAALRRRHDRGRRAHDDLRFGLSADAVRPLFGNFPAGARLADTEHPVRRPPWPATAGDAGPTVLALYEPGISPWRRLLARLGTSRAVTIGLRPRPVSAKGLASVSIGAVAGMMLAQPFDAVTFVAPLYGLALGCAGGAAAWTAVHRRRATTIVVDEWRPQLDTISRILRNADRIGQPFASPPALRVALHGALWHAVHAVGQPGDGDVLVAFDEQLKALGRATDTTLAELESSSIAARKADVTERLAEVVAELELTPARDPHPLATGDEWR